MESRWQKIGSYPLVSYFNGKGNELKLQFFEDVGGMLVMFTNPSAELVKVCGNYCAPEMAANGRDIQNLFVNFQHMYSSAATRYVIDAVLQLYACDDQTKKEIQESLDTFYKWHHTKKVRYGYGMFAPTPTPAFNQDQYLREARFKMEMATPSRAWF